MRKISPVVISELLGGGSQKYLSLCQFQFGWCPLWRVTPRQDLNSPETSRRLFERALWLSAYVPDMFGKVWSTFEQRFRDRLLSLRLWWKVQCLFYWQLGLIHLSAGFFDFVSPLSYWTTSSQATAELHQVVTVRKSLFNI